MENANKIWEIIRAAELDILQQTGKNVILTPKFIEHEMQAAAIELLNGMCDKWGVTSKWLSKRDRSQDRPIMRKIAWIAIRNKFPTLSYQNIADLTGTTNHTSVIKGIQRANNYISVKDSKIMRYIKPVEQYLK